MSMETIFTPKTNFILLRRTSSYSNKIRNKEEISSSLEDLQKQTGVKLSFLLGRQNNWYYQKGNWFYFKSMEENIRFLLNEIVGEEITKHFELSALHYEFAKLIESDITTFGIASKNFCQKGTQYLSFQELFPNYPKNFENLEFPKAIEELDLSKENKKRFIQELKLLWVRDYYTKEADRSFSNIQFQKRNDVLSLTPIYDNVLSFLPPHEIESAFFTLYAFCNFEHPKTQAMLKNDPDYQKAFTLLHEINLKRILEKIEEERHIRIPKEIKMDYLKRDQLVKKFLTQKKI